MMPKEQGKYNSFRIAVPTGYEEVFSHFYFAANYTSDVVVKTLLPSYQSILIFTFGEKASLVSEDGSGVEVGNCLVLGPVKQAFDYVLPPGAEILAVNFIGDAFYRFFGAASVAEHVPMNPDALVDENCFTGLWSRMDIIPDVDQKVNMILEFCAPYLKERNAIIGQLAGFWDNGVSTVKSVAELNNQTERNIQLLHKKHLGYSAKELSRYQRFIKAVGLLQEKAVADAKVDWIEMVAVCGYYDQSQLIRDFKYYMNLSPMQYLKLQQDICNPKT